MEKFSVRKPYTVLVAVILVMILGFVSLTEMQTDLLPPISLPYLIIVTPYPGASPERVELMVSEPMENALGTVSHVKNVYSTSSENYSLTQLEFEDGTDMDSTMVKVSSAVQQVGQTLPDGCGTPSILEISMDMVATMYAAVSREGYDRYELSDFVDDEVRPYMARQEGVASVGSIGLVDKTVQVDLNRKKIEKLNDRILEKANEGLAEAKEKLDEANEKVESGQDALSEQEQSFGEQVASGIFSQVNADELAVGLQNGIEDVIAGIDSLSISADEMEGSSELRDSLAAAGEDFKEAYESAKANAELLIEAAKAANEDYGGVAAAAVQAAFGAFDDNDQAIAGAKQNVQRVIEEGLAAYRVGIGDLEDDEIDQVISAALDTYSAAYQEITGEELPAETWTQIDADLWNTLSSRRDSAQEQSAKAQETADSAEKLAEKLLTATDAIGDMSAAADSADSVLSTEDASQKLQAAIGELREAQNSLDGTTMTSLTKGITQLSAAGSIIRQAIGELQAIDFEGILADGIADVETMLYDLEDQAASLPEVMDGLEGALAALMQGQLDAALGFSEGARQLAEAQKALRAAESQYEEARKQALKQANVDALVSASTLSQLIYAQNFAMPAGYIDDRHDNSWLLKVGNEFETSGDIADALLADIDGIGTVRLTDVADITVIDNADKSFTSVNGEEAVVLAIYKGSTAGTNEVSRNLVRAIAELEENEPGTSVTTLMDQGRYITLIVKDILTSMGLGALLAVLILALFLRDIRPTVMVGISIPLSVLFTVVLMYFTGLSMNMMTLGGLSLGIGMLVDNSIVVMENIMRLRGRGVSSAGASVQGAKQVAGAIISSTLTTVCVFLPMVFTEGTVRSLLVPMALSITYCLTASLVVALTVIPASASVILRTSKKEQKGLFDRVLAIYGKTLRWCLKRKAVPLLLSAALLAVSVTSLIRMGIVVLPEMSSDTLQMTIVTPEDATREESYGEMEEIISACREVPGVTSIGAMDSAGTLSLISGINASSDAYGRYICYISVEEGANGKKVKRILKDLQEKVQDFPGEIEVSAGGMSDMSALVGSGLTVNIYGTDLDELKEIASKVAGLAGSVEGYENISDGTEDDAPALHLVIDKDKAMAKGFTVAQIYGEIAARTTTQVTSTTITDGSMQLDVVISDETDPLTRENLLEMELGKTSASGMGAGMGQGMTAGGMASANASADSFSSLSGDAGDLMAAFSGTEDEEEGEKEQEEEEEEEEEKPVKLREIAKVVETTSPSSIARENQKRYRTVTASTAEGYNTALLSRQMRPLLREFGEDLPNGYSVEISGETTQVERMVTQMSKMIALALAFIYFVMVAQFQSLLSPFIILFTIPLAFTGGMIGLLALREQLSMMSLMGFLVLMGTVVNNGIVFVDYVNQLRIGGLSREDALIAAGKTRMRPILMTALTTILAMTQLIFGSGMGSQMGRGMAVVIAAGLLYATLMTLFIVPVMYDILYKKQPLAVSLDGAVDEMPDDAADYLRTLREEKE